MPIDNNMSCTFLTCFALNVCQLKRMLLIKKDANNSIVPTLVAREAFDCYFREDKFGIFCDEITKAFKRCMHVQKAIPLACESPEFGVRECHVCDG